MHDNAVYVNCERFDRKHGYCIEGKDCTCGWFEQQEREATHDKPDYDNLPQLGMRRRAAPAECCSVEGCEHPAVLAETIGYWGMEVWIALCGPHMIAKRNVMVGSEDDADAS